MINKQDGYTLPPGQKHWVHAGCLKPSRMYYKRMILDELVEEVKEELNWPEWQKEILEDFYNWHFEDE